MVEGWVGSILCVPCPYRADGFSGSTIHPYGSVYQVGGNMAVGADWKKYGDDYSDWGVIQTKQSMGIDWRPRLYVEIDTWLSTSREVSVYGYPYGNSVMYESSGNLMGCSRVRVYSCDGFTYAGMVVVSDMELGRKLRYVFAWFLAICVIVCWIVDVLLLCFLPGN